MLYCHSRGVVHRDLKLENVLFINPDESDFRVKVVDFGIAGMGQEKVDAGTLAYMAPECLEKVAADTNPAMDVWAIGIMFYAMIYGTLPFHSSNERDLIKSIKNDIVKFPNTHPITPEGRDLIKRMLVKDPTQRIQLIDLVQLEYNTIDDDEFNNKYNTLVNEINKKKEKQIEEEEKL
jgi:serine/threonine protein kinase